MMLDFSRLCQDERAELARIFLERCDLVGRCLVWNRGKIAGGYGQMTFNKQKAHSHRLSHELFIGPIGDLCVLHTCDVRACCNSFHLFLGTHADNHKDMDAKGRRRIGQSISPLGLTNTDVISIRSDTRTQRVIAAAYGMSQQHVSQLKTKIRWKHL